jgi:hypothetical protein
MSELVFELEASFDRKVRPAVAYLRVREGQRAETREIVDGAVNAKYDRDGKLLAVELYGRCDLKALCDLAAGEPEEVRRFLLGAVPRDLIRPSSSEDQPNGAGPLQSGEPHAPTSPAFPS